MNGVLRLASVLHYPGWEAVTRVRGVAKAGGYLSAAPLFTKSYWSPRPVLQDQKLSKDHRACVQTVPSSRQWPPTQCLQAKNQLKAGSRSSATLALLALAVFLWSGLQLVSHSPRCPSICSLMLAEHRSDCAPPSWLCHKHWMQESGRLFTHLTPAMSLKQVTKASKRGPWVASQNWCCALWYYLHHTMHPLCSPGAKLTSFTGVFSEKCKIKHREQVFFPSCLRINNNEQQL